MADAAPRVQPRPLSHHCSSLAASTPVRAESPASSQPPSLISSQIIGLSRGAGNGNYKRCSHRNWWIICIEDTVLALWGMPWVSSKQEIHRTGKVYICFSNIFSQFLISIKELFVTKWRRLPGETKHYNYIKCRRTEAKWVFSLDPISANLIFRIQSPVHTPPSTGHRRLLIEL